MQLPRPSEFSDMKKGAHPLFWPTAQRFRKIALGALVSGALGCSGCTKVAEQPVAAPAQDGATPSEDLGGPTGEFSPESGDFELVVEDDKAPKKRPQPKPVNARDDAWTALAKGNPEGALTFLSQWLASHPGDHLARVAATHAALRVGDIEGAKALLKAGDQVRRGPASQPAAVVDRLRLHARVARLQGDAKAAEGHLQAALAKIPDHAATRGELLELWMHTGRRETPEARKLMDGLYDSYESGAATDLSALMAVARAGIARGTSGAYQDANMVLGEAEQVPDAAGDTLAFLARDAAVGGRDDEIVVDRRDARRIAEEIGAPGGQTKANII